MRTYCRTHLALFIPEVRRSACPSFISQCLLKIEPITLCLTDINFHWAFFYQENIWRNMALSQYFSPVVKIDPKPEKIPVIIK